MKITLMSGIRALFRGNLTAQHKLGMAPLSAGPLSSIYQSHGTNPGHMRLLKQTVHVRAPLKASQTSWLHLAEPARAAALTKHTLAEHGSF